MRVVQTVFVNDERISQTLTDGEPGLAYTGGAKLIVSRRRPKPTDWVNGEFVGDHNEPTDKDEVHVHGEP